VVPLNFIWTNYRKHMKQYQDITRTKKKVSNLWKEVDLGFRACDAWNLALTHNREPKDILVSLPRKTQRLFDKIKSEPLDLLTDVSKEMDKLILELEAKGDKTHPQIFYKKGKQLMGKAEWLDAKNCFLTYERYALAKDSRCLNPSDDNFYFYLSQIQKQMNAQQKDNPDLKFTVVTPGNDSNPYEKKYKEWKEQNPPSASALMSQAPTRVPTTVSVLLSTTDRVPTGPSTTIAPPPGPSLNS